MGDTSIDGALERIGSTKQRDRRDGLYELKHILTVNRRSSTPLDLRDRAYHAIFEALFRFASSEKANYLRYSKAGKASAASLLSECAGVFRLAAEAGVKDLRQKTLRAVIDHITEILPEENGFCEPLAADYVRILKTILQHPPHPSHLTEQQWLHAVEFFKTAISTHVQDTEESDSFNVPVPSRSGRRPNRQSRASSPSSLSGTVTPITKSFVGKETRTFAPHHSHLVSDLISCLYYLLRVPHAHVTAVARASLDVIHDFLSNTTQLSHPQGQEKAFGCINIILTVAETENNELACLTYERSISAVKRLWHTKAHDALKEQMLASLILGMPLLERVADSIGPELEPLLDALTAEYCKRHERDMLQLEDLDLRSSDAEQPTALQFGSFGVRTGSSRAELAVAILMISSMLFVTAGRMSGADTTITERQAEMDGLASRKRQKMNDPLESFIDSVVQYSGSEQIARTQILAFLPSNSQLTSRQMNKCLGRLNNLVSLDSAPVSSWAMCAVANFATRLPDCVKTVDSDVWLQLWSLSTRKITQAASSRAASFMMVSLVDCEALPLKVISETFDAILSSVEFNGPAAFDESSSELWNRLIVFKSKHSPSSTADALEAMLRWIALRWKPSRILSAQSDSLSRTSPGPEVILGLFSMVVSRPFVTNKQIPRAGLSTIALAHLRVLRSRDLTDFLFLKPELSKSTWALLEKPNESSAINLSDAQIHRLFGLSVGFLSGEISSALETLQDDGANIRNLTAEHVYVLASLCLVSFWAAIYPMEERSQRCQRLKTQGLSLRSELLKLILEDTGSNAVWNGLLDSVGSVAQLSQREKSIRAPVLLMTEEFDCLFWSTVQGKPRDSANEVDLMNMDGEINSQPNPRDIAESGDMPIDWLSCYESRQAHRAHLTLRVCYFSCLAKSSTSSSQLQDSITMLLEFLLRKDPREFLDSRPFLQELFSAEPSTVLSDVAEPILSYLGEEVMYSYDFERSETAMGTCLDVLSFFTKLWMASDGGDVADLALQFYQWFITVALGKKIASPHTHVCMARMLQKVIVTDPDYATNTDVPPPRAVLLKVLEESQVHVKYEIGIKISEVFGSFVLEEHDAILEDILESLPMDVDWLEGTAIRMLILSYLGSCWRTLIRRCLFALVEAPYLVPTVAKYAQRSVHGLAVAMDLESTSQLFRLFASQITYSWLESRPLTALPYTVFGYADLREMVHDVQEEITAQTLMKGRESDARDLATILATPYQDLLQASFGKTAAYAIARDAAIRPESDQEAADAVSRLRRGIGKEKYSALLAEKFPAILASLFSLLDREDSVVKGFQRYDVHTTSQMAYEEIISNCASASSLAISQQPSFKASYLADEIDYICSRTGHNAAEMWTPALYCFVFRHLLTSIHSALGPLHKVAVIRRMRILISMAGRTALQDYPLETTIHALRQFINHIYCSEDIIGVFRYLFIKGLDYLQSRPSFFTGVAVATLVSLRQFMNSPQDSTTQESHYRATMASGAAFHSWLTKFVEDCDIHDDAKYSKKGQRELVDAANRFRGSGSAENGTPEGDLLKFLLRDQMTETNLVAPPYRKVIIGGLQPIFSMPEKPRDDILYEDQDVTEYATAVWNSLDGADSDSSYALWVARVLGRAYSASGHICHDLSQEISLDFSARDTMKLSQFLTSESRFAILSALESYLLSENPTEAGYVEQSLQAVFTKMEKDQAIGDCLDRLPQSLLHTLDWKPYKPPENADVPHVSKIADVLVSQDPKRHSQWVQLVCLSLINHGRHDHFLSAVSHSIRHIEGLALKLFPEIVHLVLLHEYDRSTSPKELISSAISELFEGFNEDMTARAKLMIQLILYLRTQQLPKETSIRDRSSWLNIDYRLAAEVASRCRMFKTGLLLLEWSLIESERPRSKRTSVFQAEVPNDLLRIIFRNLDDKDSYLGLKQAPNLKAYMDRSQFDNASFRSLSLLSAFHDSEIQLHSTPNSATEASLAEVLDKLDLNGLSDSVVSKIESPDVETRAIMFETARKLERWDLATPLEISAPSSEVFRAFQNIHEESTLSGIRSSLDKSLANTLSIMKQKPQSSVQLQSAHETFAALSEAEDLLFSEGFDELHQKWLLMQKREAWMLTSSLDHSRSLLSNRRTILSMLSKSTTLQNLVRITASTARSIEVRALLLSASLVRRHEALQTCLGISAQLDDLVGPCKELGIQIDVASQFEASNVLWDQGEMETSISILQHISENSDLAAQEIPVAQSVLLAKLGQRMSEARLERPDEILKRYLIPAINALRDQTTGPEAGQVYHEFAAFCDQQLQNSDSIEDMNRLRMMRDRKEAEVKELDKMLKGGVHQGRERDNIKSVRNKAKQWLDIDHREYERLKQSRQVLLNQSLENYLLSLRACDTFDADALRFATLWLEHSGNDDANNAAAAVANVPSRKFAPLMNQWTSRLLDSPSSFQQLLSNLILRICEDHPFHSLYHVFASSKSKGGKDQTSLSRHTAANNIALQLRDNRKTTAIWNAIHGSSVNYVKFAQEKPNDGSMKLGSRIALKASPTGQKLEQDARKLRIPPPTLHIGLRPDCDYSNVPVIARFQAEFTVASGISMPKIVTAIGSNGKKYKQLFKSGNDDLRQDSIMEQVFAQVSDLLKSQRATRQRNLGIRTYKVLPLTATSGIIEFVSNTKPLHDYLMPAHQKYHTNDLRNNACRRAIQEVQQKPSDVRVKTYQQVCARFNPVLRYFFMERFELPDDWYARRLAYTRSTAAISILGHILGLGDRHGHNILLDEQTGEVVHIDLGIAFEQGRVLPVPEVVPFRLTRDLVDGMGVTKTEGVFRRCCEFTLDALRKEAESIMTILDVLRYDPLYSWSLSPLRLKRLQDDQQAEALAAVSGQEQQQQQQEKKDEQGEADRALTVVNKKLSKTLSVAATVNELIQQATDERNLALLYCGWAAYA